MSCLIDAERTNSAEAAIALRQRLNETVDQFETLRKSHTELEVNFETQSRELTIAKSDRELDIFLVQFFSITVNSEPCQQGSIRYPCHAERFRKRRQGRS